MGWDRLLWVLVVGFNDSVFVAGGGQLFLVYLIDLVGIGNRVVVVIVKAQSFQRVKVCFLEALRYRLLQHVHVFGGDRIGLGDDRDNCRLALQRAQDLQIQVFI